MTTGDIRIVEVDDVVCAFEPVAWEVARRHADAIEAHWTKLVAQGRGRFNGPALVMHRWAIEETADGRRVLTGAFLRTDYKSFVAWRDLDLPDLDLPEAGTKNVFAMAALRARDGAFIVGEMSTGTTLPGRLQFPAGTPDLDDVRGETVDLAASALRELEEETGLTPADVAVRPGWALVIEGRKIACMKRMDLPLDGGAAVAHIGRLLAAQEDPELVAVHAVAVPAEAQAARMPGFMKAYLAHERHAEPGAGGQGPSNSS